MVKAYVSTLHKTDKEKMFSVLALDTLDTFLKNKKLNSLVTSQ